MPLVPIDRADHPWVWLAYVGTVLLYVVGDGVTTLVIFVGPALYETNRFVVWTGPVGFVALKLVVLGIVWLVTRTVVEFSGPDYSFLPLTYCGTLAILGAYLTVWNLRLIARAYLL